MNGPKLGKKTYCYRFVKRFFNFLLIKFNNR